MVESHLSCISFHSEGLCANSPTIKKVILQKAESFSVYIFSQWTAGRTDCQFGVMTSTIKIEIIERRMARHATLYDILICLTAMVGGNGRS